MVTKNELIEMLRLAIDFEEEVNPIVGERCMECLQELQKLEMAGHDKQRMRQLLLELISRSKEHERQIETLIKEIQESPQDEF